MSARCPQTRQSLAGEFLPDFPAHSVADEHRHSPIGRFSAKFFHVSMISPEEATMPK